jgi:hypothetical protein
MMVSHSFSSVEPAVAGPLTLVNYIAVPADAANVQPGGAFSAFDISYADPVTGDIFIADRSDQAENPHILVGIRARRRQP